jgi:hypothetical protein
MSDLRSSDPPRAWVRVSHLCGADPLMNMNLETEEERIAIIYDGRVVHEPEFISALETKATKIK